MCCLPSCHSIPSNQTNGAGCYVVVNVGVVDTAVGAHGIGLMARTVVPMVLHMVPRVVAVQVTIKTSLLVRTCGGKAVHLGVDVCCCL